MSFARVISAHELARELDGDDAAYVCPSCYRINLVSEEVQRVRCPNCRMETAAVDVFRMTASAWDAVYFGYMYGKVRERDGQAGRRSSYKLTAPDAVLVIVGVFILQRFAGKTVDDAYDYIKPRLLSFLKQWKGKLQRRMLGGTRCRMRQLNNILRNDESLREFIDLFMKGLGNAVRIYGFPKLFRTKRSKRTPPKSTRRKARS